MNRWRYDINICFYLLAILSCELSVISAKSYENGLIFYNITTKEKLLPPAVTSVSLRSALQLPSMGQPCSCSQSKCECCVGIKIDRFNFDQKMCANMIYDFANLEMRMEVFLNERNIVMYSISARNPPPFCIPVPLPIPVFLCMKLYDIRIVEQNVQMCMDWLVRVMSSDIYSLHFRCFQLGAGGIQVLPEDEEAPDLIQGDVGGDIYDEVDLDRSCCS